MHRQDHCQSKLEKHNKEEVEVILVDGFEKTKRYARFIIEDGYRVLQSKFKWFYEFIYAIHKVRIISEISSYLVSINMEKYLSEMIQKEKPEKIVSSIFLLSNRYIK